MIRCTYSRSHEGKLIDKVDFITGSVSNANRLVNRWNAKGTDYSYEVVNHPQLKHVGLFREEQG